MLVPTHNRAGLVRFSIESVLAQTVQDFEILVVADGCTDDTAAVVAGFADPRIRLFELPKAPGFGYANRNVALREARGQLVAFLADDNIWLPDHLERLSRPFADSEIVLAYSRPIVVVYRELLVPLAYDLEHPVMLQRWLAMRPGLPGSVFVHRRDALDRWGYLNPDLRKHGDHELWCRFVRCSGRPPAYVREPTSLHFRAPWRPEGRPRTLLVWKRLDEIPGYLPPALRVPVPDGVPEQQAIWRTISADPVRWTAGFRAAVLQALDLRVAGADHLLVALLPRWPAEADPDAFADDLLRMGDEFAALNASVAWRLVRGARRWRERALPFGSRRSRVWERLTRRLRPPET